MGLDISKLKQTGGDNNNNCYAHISHVQSLFNKYTSTSSSNSTIPRAKLSNFVEDLFKYVHAVVTPKHIVLKLAATMSPDGCIVMKRKPFAETPAPCAQKKQLFTQTLMNQLSDVDHLEWQRFFSFACATLMVGPVSALPTQ